MAARNSATASLDLYPANPTAPFAASLYPSIEYQILPEGTAGTMVTLDAMRDAVLGRIDPDYSGYQDEWNRQAAIQICQSGRNGDPVHGLFDFVRDQIVYIDHPWNLQVVQDCQRTLQLATGDCVSKSVCLATLLAALGYTPRFVAQASDGKSADHVYVEVWASTAWLCLDPTADGKDRRPLGDVGWYRRLPDGAWETTKDIF